MSYDISLRDPITHEEIEVDEPHFMRGGTYQIGGCQTLWLNITYNYGQYYRREDVLGEKGIRAIYGMTGAESIPILEKPLQHWEMTSTRITGPQRRETPNGHFFS